MITWCEIEKVEELEDNNYVYDIELENNHYFPSNGIVSHNCRLVSQPEMLKLASQVNSFGGGGSISLGSHRVCTINFNRIALECKDYDDYFKILENRLEDSTKILVSHKELIKNLTKQGLQMFISNGWINMNRMFSTFGLIGIYEACQYMNEKFGSYDDLEKDILVFVNKKVEELSVKYNISGNIEQIPAESFAIRLCNADKILFGEDKVNYKIYANQFIPLWNDATIWEKMEADGRLNKLITGGSLVHCQIGERVTSKQAEKIIRYAVQSGCEHFALNSVWSQCEHNHASFGKVLICPICGGKIVDYLTRVVGFFTPVSSWTKIRREWEFENRKFNNLDQI